MKRIKQFINAHLLSGILKNLCRSVSVVDKDIADLSPFELPEEAGVVFGEEAEVADTVLEVGDAFDTHAESVAGIDAGVDAAGLKVVRVDHTAAENLHPAGVFAEAASLAAADIAADVHLGTRLGEWEVTRAEAYLRVGTEHLTGKGEQHLLEVGEADVPVYIEPFYLMEEAVGACRDGLVAVDAARTEHADRRLVGRHIMCLVVGSMAAEKHVLRHVHRIAALDEEGVLHIARRMVGGEVQHGEHVLVVVNLRTLIEREAHPCEDVDDFVLDKCQRMPRTQADGVGGACKVDVVALCLAGLELVLQLVDSVLCELLEFVDFHADGLLLVGRHIPELTHQCVDFAFLAEVFQSELFHVAGILCRKCAHFLEKFFYLV